MLLDKIFMPIINAGNTVSSVSYTHLDVYKRQQCMGGREEIVADL